MTSPYQPQQNPSTVWQPVVAPSETTESGDGDVIVVRDPERRRLTLVWVIPATVVVLLAVFAAGWWGGATYTRNGGSSSSKTEALAAAQAKCDASRIGTTVADEGRTLTVDGKGTDDLLSGRGIDDQALVCLMDALQIPQAVREHMSQTRALDGRQTDAWNGFTASWSYHPDSGINLIVQVA